MATFNTHTEALQPMAGALWTSYDASFPAIWVEAMKKPSRAGGKPAKARRHNRAVKQKGRSAPKAMPRRGSAPAGQGAEVARLTRELNEALEQQTATSEVLQVISSTPGDLQPVFQTMLEKAVCICDAKFGNRNTWATASSSTLATRKPMRTTPSGRYGQGWS
jgi:hypothetical protein